MYESTHARKVRAHVCVYVWMEGCAEHCAVHTVSVYVCIDLCITRYASLIQ